MSRPEVERERARVRAVAAGVEWPTVPGSPTPPPTYSLPSDLTASLRRLDDQVSRLVTKVRERRGAPTGDGSPAGACDDGGPTVPGSPTPSAPYSLPSDLTASLHRLDDWASRLSAVLSLFKTLDAFVERVERVEDGLRRSDEAARRDSGATREPDGADDEVEQVLGGTRALGDVGELDADSTLVSEFRSLLSALLERVVRGDDRGGELRTRIWRLAHGSSPAVGQSGASTPAVGGDEGAGNASSGVPTVGVPTDIEPGGPAAPGSVGGAAASAGDGAASPAGARGVVIATAEDLAAVPWGHVVRSAAGTIACRSSESRGVVFGDDRSFPWHALQLPAEVIWPLSVAPARGQAPVPPAETITTLEGLEALLRVVGEQGLAACVRDRDHRTHLVWEDERGDWWALGHPVEGDLDAGPVLLESLGLPLTVLYRPGAESLDGGPR